MARNGDPDDEFYSEPTQYADYSELGSSGQAYSEVPPQSDYPTGFSYSTGDYPPAPAPEPWYRKPAALIGLGGIGVIIAALVIYALVNLFGGGSGSAPSDTTTTVTTTPESTATTDSGQTPVVPPAQTETVTETPTTTAPAETTSEAPTTTTVPTETVTETETATETVTTTRTRPTLTLPSLPAVPGGGADSGQ